MIYPFLKPFIHITSSPRPLSGFASFDVKVKGTVKKPIIDSTWELLEVGMQETKIEEVVGKANYHDEVLYLERILVKGFGNELTIKGRMPLNLALVPVEERFLDEPVDIDINGRNIDFAFITSLSKQLEKAKGYADIELQIRGTSAKPHLEGAVLIKDGSMSFFNFDVPINLDDILLTASKGNIQINAFDFKIGKGRCSTKAHLEMDGLLPDKLVLDRFTADNIQIADFARNFLRGELARNISGDVSVNTKDIQVNLKELLAIREADESERERVPRNSNPFAVLRCVSGELIIKKDMLLSLAGHDIQPTKEIYITLEERTLGCSFELKESNLKGKYDEYEPFYIKAGAHWQLGDKLLFDLDGYVDVRMIEEFMPKNERKGFPYDVKGKFHYELALRGVEDNPKMTFNWNTENLAIERAYVDTFVGTIKYENQALRIEKVEAAIGNNYVRLTGVIPLGVSLLEMRGRFLDKDSKLTLDAQLENLKFLPLIDSNYTDAQGKGSLHITAGGDIRAPDFAGSVEIKNINLKVLYPNLEFRKTNIQLSLDNNRNDRIKVDKFSGMLNGGTYEIDGYVGLSKYMPNELNLRGNWSECTFSEINLYKVKCSGGAELTGQLNMPHLAGKVDIIRGEYKQHWRQLVREMLKSDIDVKNDIYFDYPILRYLEVDFNVQAPNNLWLNTPGMAIIETCADGKLLGSLNNLIFVGQVDILKGDIWYFEHKFTVKKGRVYNDIPQGKFNPQYEIRAETSEGQPLENIPLSDKGTNRIKTKDIRVIVQMKGTLEKPGEPGLRAEVLHKAPDEKYELDREQIISILTVGIPEIRNLNGSISGTASELIKKRTEWYLSSMFAGKLGLRELKFDISPSAFEESRVLFTKELTPSWAITYSSSLQLHEEPRIEAEYELLKSANKNISVAGERDEKGQFGVDLKFEYKFK